MPADAAVYAKLDGDAYVDVALKTLNQTANGLVVARGTASGQFTAPVAVSVVDPGNELFAADLDGDLDNDLLMVHADRVTTFTNDGSGAFGPQVVAVTGVEVTDLADVDGDGIPDLIDRADPGALRLWRGLPGGGFGAPLSVLSAPPLAQWQALDLDGDGIVDLAGGEPFTGLVWIAHATAPAAFAAPTAHLGASSWFVKLRSGDIDGDGHADLLARRVDQGVTTLLGDGTGSVVSAEHSPGGVMSPMVSADFDQDGRLDVAGYLGTAIVGVQYGEFGGGFSAPSSYAAGENFLCLAAGDLDQDGFPDLVASRKDQPVVQVLLGDGAGGLLPPVAVPAGPYAYTPAIGEVTGDGVPDIVVAEAGHSIGQIFLPGLAVRVLPGVGDGTFLAPVSYPLPPGVWWPMIGDVDLDGLNDVVVGTQGGPMLLLGLRDGTLGPASTMYSAFNNEWSRPSLVDFDADGDLDFVHAYPVSPSPLVRVLLGDGLDAFPDAITVHVALAGDVAVSDFDGDGMNDVALSGFTLLLSDGQNGLGPPRRYAASGAHLVATDVDGDGRTDLVGTGLIVNRNLGPAPAIGVYCTAKLNTSGCEPSIGWSGTPSASRASGFTVTATDLVNQKLGLLLYGLNGSAATPFGGGTRCLAPPPRRTVVTNTGGSAPPASDCTGTIAIDMNAFAAGVFGNPDPALSIAGTHVHCQTWARDKAPSYTQLSDGLQYFVQP